jgi:hypothetical protein
MKTVWIVASGSQRPDNCELNDIKHIGPIWGAHNTWRSWKTDNVVASGVSACKLMLERKIQLHSNLYIPRTLYSDLGRPNDVNLYDSPNWMEAKDIDDVIAMNLAAANSDIVLLFGFDLSTPESSGDTIKDRMVKNRYGIILSLIRGFDHTQWVLIDPPSDTDASFGSLANFTCDSLSNVLTLLSDQS